jgi:hypothetical protein
MLSSFLHVTLLQMDFYSFVIVAQYTKFVTHKYVMDFMMTGVKLSAYRRLH